MIHQGLSIWTDYLKEGKKKSFRRFLVADGSSRYIVNWAWAHLDILVLRSAFILQDNTEKWKTVMHHRGVLGHGQGSGFG